MRIKTAMSFVRSCAKPSLTLLILLTLVVGKVVAQGDVTNQFQVLVKVAFMGKMVTNELACISTNVTIALDLRQYAGNVLTNHDESGTNTLATLEYFIAGWSITNEPAVSSNLITTMKQTLEYGISARAQLDTYQANTNNPPSLRQAAGRFLNALRGGN